MYLVLSCVFWLIVCCGGIGYVLISVFHREWFFVFCVLCSVEYGPCVANGMSRSVEGMI